MNDPIKPAQTLGPDVMHALRAHLVEQVIDTEPDVIAVIVLTGSPERGLALSVSSIEPHMETVGLLAHALADDPIFETVIPE